MKFEPGHSKVGGRQKGTPNKATRDLRKAIGDFLSDRFEEVGEVWSAASERDKLTFYVQLLRFALPQLQSVEMTSEFERMTDAELRMIIDELKQVQNGEQE